MAHSRKQFDPSDDDDDDWRDDEEWDADNDEPTVACPYCRQEIHEDAPRCPHCGRYISREDAPRQPKSWFIIFGVIACLYVVYRWIF